MENLSFPGGAAGNEPTCQGRRCKRHGFDPWVGKIPWKRKWQPTPVFLPGTFHGQRSLAGYSLGGCKESDMMSTYTHTQTGISNGEWPFFTLGNKELETPDFFLVSVF